MGIKEMLGVEPERKVRYAIVGLGDIAQEDMMPGVEHTGNSEITALITSDQTKASEWVANMESPLCSVMSSLKLRCIPARLMRFTLPLPIGDTPSSFFPR